MLLDKMHVLDLELDEKCLRHAIKTAANVSSFVHVVVVAAVVAVVVAAAAAAASVGV